MWEIALALAKAIMAEQQRRELAAANEELANRIIEAVTAAIRQSTQQILDFLKQQRLDVLAGRVEGLFVTFTRYAADPRASGNHQRLVNLIDELAQLVGDLGRIVARIDTDQRPALDAFPIYASAVALSTLAITERRHRFKVNEPLGGLLDAAKRHALRVKDVLRRQSDDRFRLASQRSEPGHTDFGYMFEDRFVLVDIVFDRGNPAAVIERTRREMAAHQEREFPNYPGLRELLEFIGSLDDTIGVQLLQAALLIIGTDTGRGATDDAWEAAAPVRHVWAQRFD